MSCIPLDPLSQSESDNSKTVSESCSELSSPEEQQDLGRTDQQQRGASPPQSAAFPGSALRPVKVEVSHPVAPAPRLKKEAFELPILPSSDNTTLLVPVKKEEEDEEEGKLAVEEETPAIGNFDEDRYCMDADWPWWESLCRYNMEREQGGGGEPKIPGWASLWESVLQTHTQNGSKIKATDSIHHVSKFWAPQMAENFGPLSQGAPHGDEGHICFKDSLYPQEICQSLCGGLLAAHTYQIRQGLVRPDSPAPRCGYLQGSFNRRSLLRQILKLLVDAKFLATHKRGVILALRRWVNLMGIQHLKTLMNKASTFATDIPHLHCEAKVEPVEETAPPPPLPDKDAIPLHPTVILSLPLEGSVQREDAPSVLSEEEQEQQQELAPGLSPESSISTEPPQTVELEHEKDDEPLADEAELPLQTVVEPRHEEKEDEPLVAPVPPLAQEDAPPVPLLNVAEYTMEAPGMNARPSPVRRLYFDEAGSGCPLSGSQAAQQGSLVGEGQRPKSDNDDSLGSLASFPRPTDEGDSGEIVKDGDYGGEAKVQLDHPTTINTLPLFPLPLPRPVPIRLSRGSMMPEAKPQAPEADSSLSPSTSPTGRQSPMPATVGSPDLKVPARKVFEAPLDQHQELWAMQDECLNSLDSLEGMSSEATDKLLVLVGRITTALQRNEGSGGTAAIPHPPADQCACEAHRGRVALLLRRPPSAPPSDSKVGANVSGGDREQGSEISAPGPVHVVSGPTLEARSDDGVLPASKDAPPPPASVALDRTAVDLSAPATPKDPSPPPNTLLRTLVELVRRLPFTERLSDKTLIFLAGFMLIVCAGLTGSLVYLLTRPKLPDLYSAHRRSSELSRRGSVEVLDF